LLFQLLGLSLGRFLNFFHFLMDFFSFGIITGNEKEILLLSWQPLQRIKGQEIAAKMVRT